jgi:polysaccharide deacetylase family protein (PEP-CTERM system associated)
MAGLTAESLNVTPRPDGELPAEGQVILSFDVEEHFRIEAAAGLAFGADVQAYYGARIEPSTNWLLDQLGRFGARATFFVVGQIARRHPGLIRAIHRAGHEVASHSWDHQRLHQLTPAGLREDVRRSKDVLEQLTGEAMRGYRAPTFSVVRQTAWAVDVLAELGLAYDSSIYPVRHDRYGVPQAPRAPFCVQGARHSLLELPPATLSVLGLNIALGGGGYFRLLPLFLLERAVAQLVRECRPAVATLYFHPWEFDPRQARLPLGRVSGFRTYVGIRRSRPRLVNLLARYEFVRAIDVAARLLPHRDKLPRFVLAGSPDGAALADPGRAPGPSAYGE